MMWKSLGCGILVMLLLSGCGAHEKTNNLIAQANTDRFKAFTKGMNASTSEGARIAMAMAFAGNMGQQNFYKEDSALDWVLGVGRIVTPLVPLFWQSGDSSSQGITAGRDVFFQSTRADSHWNYQSATNEYLLGDNNWNGSNDAEVPLESDHSVSESTSTTTTPVP